jgi:hypothetical protein
MTDKKRNEISYNINEMSSYSTRLKSFDKYDRCVIDPRIFARAGFHYCGPSDTVICFSCGLTLNKWSIGDDPIHAHNKHSPDCIYLNITDVLCEEKSDEMQKILNITSSLMECVNEISLKCDKQTEIIKCINKKTKNKSKINNHLDDEMLPLQQIILDPLLPLLPLEQIELN